MPHAAYAGMAIVCPWLGCDYRIEFVDFQLELKGNTAFYAQVMTHWGRLAGYGLIGRCPGCGKYVLFGVPDKQTVTDPGQMGLPVLPDDWHLGALIAS